MTIVLLLVYGVSGYADDRPAHQHFEVSIVNRSAQLEPNVLRVTQDASVSISFTSDEAVSLHLHGYDIECDVRPDEPETITFVARATGRFPITSHGFAGIESHSHQALLYVEVYPD